MIEALEQRRMFSAAPALQPKEPPHHPPTYYILDVDHDHDKHHPDGDDIFIIPTPIPYPPAVDVWP